MNVSRSIHSARMSSQLSQFHKTGNIVSSVNFGSKMQIMLPLHEREF